MKVVGDVREEREEEVILRNLHHSNLQTLSKPLFIHLKISQKLLTKELGISLTNT